MAPTLRRVLAALTPTPTASGCSSRAARKQGTGVSSASGRSRALISILLPVVLAAAACGRASSPLASSPKPSPSATATFPVTVAATNGPVSIPRRPVRIVSLSPTATEMLFAIDAGSQVVAVDDNSNYPPQAPITKLSGFQPNVEAIAKYTPDLVVISNDTGNLVKSLQALSIPVLLEPAAASLNDTYAQIEQLGVATGHVADAARLVASMKSQIQQLVASGPTFSHPLTYYHELDQTYYTATSATFIGQVYSLLGLENIADQAKGAASGYPQLSAEYIIKANPDVIFLADTKCCRQSLQTVSKRPGWDEITAVRAGAVVALDDDVASRWGPRVVDYIKTIVQTLTDLEPKLQSASP